MCTDNNGGKNQPTTSFSFFAHSVAYALDHRIQAGLVLEEHTLIFLGHS